VLRFLDILGRYEAAELNQLEAADLLGVDERTFRRWRVRFEEEAFYPQFPQADSLARTPNLILVKRKRAYYIGFMQQNQRTTEKTLYIKTLVHKGTGALLAVSDDLSGFMVAGKTHEEIENKLAGALRDHFDLLGFELISIDVSSEDDDEVAGFDRSLPAFIARASLGEKHVA
jgi:hypothetical protein